MRILSSSPQSRKLVLLAPADSALPGLFTRIEADQSRYESLFAEMQRLRGSVYLEIGAIEPWQLTAGRHQLGIDHGSWHLLVLEKDGRVSGCARYREYSNETTFSQLTVSHSALAHCPEWGGKLEAAVESELGLSRRSALPFVELGGWALDEQIRGTAEALRMALATYALAQGLGGATGITTANRCNCSASILRRIGGRPLEHGGTELPPYYEPQYKREIEILRFYSWAPNPRYSAWIDEIRSQLQAIPVLSAGSRMPLRSLSCLRPTFAH